MSYSSTIGIHLLETQTGLALYAQLVDEDDDEVGDPITTGFSEVGSGGYLWTNTFTSGFRGAAKFYSSPDNTYLKVFATIDPLTAQAAASVGGGTVSGNYITDQDVKDLAGSENVRLASNLDNANQVQDSSRVLRGIRFAEAKLNTRVREVYPVPLAVSGDDLTLVVDVCARLALWWLSQNKGITDENKNIAGKMENHYKLAMVQIGRWATRTDKLEIGTKYRSPDGPMAVTRQNYNSIKTGRTENLDIESIGIVPTSDNTGL